MHVSLDVKRVITVSQEWM